MCDRIYVRLGMRGLNRINVRSHICAIGHAGVLKCGSLFTHFWVKSHDPATTVMGCMNSHYISSTSCTCIECIWTNNTLLLIVNGISGVKRQAASGPIYPVPIHSFVSGCLNTTKLYSTVLYCTLEARPGQKCFQPPLYFIFPRHNTVRASYEHKIRLLTFTTIVIEEW